jgi:hypothetical protein
MLEYSVPQPCLDVERYYQTEMQSAGWSVPSSSGSGSSWAVLEFEKERDSVQVHLSSSPVGQPKCNLQIFYHKYSPLDTFIPQRIFGITVILAIQVAFGYLGGRASMGKGRHPAIGWLLGFFLGFMGDFFILTWEPRRDNFGRMIGWNEYKLMSKEEKEALRQSNAISSSEVRKQRMIFAILIVILVAVLIFQVLRNLGRL